MKKLVVKRLALNLIFLSQVLYASASEPVKADLTGYYTKDSLPYSPANLDRALNSSVRLATDTGNGSNCSAVILSNDGYVATALHCLNHFLNGTLDFKSHLKMRKKNSGTDYSFWEVLTQIPPTETIPNVLTDPYYIWEYDLKLVKFVWFGKGRHNHDEHKITKLSQRDFNEFKELTDDVVILKYEPIEPNKKISCLPLAKEKPQLGDMVWGIGYPDTALRENGNSANGYDELVSLGLVRTSVRQDPVLQKIAESVALSERNLFWKRESQIWEKPSILISSIDLSPGNSGGMVINKLGELVGITFSTTVVDSKKATHANSYAIDTVQLFNTIRADLGEKVAQSIFNCNSE